MAKRFNMKSLSTMTNDERVLAFLSAKKANRLDAITSFDTIGVHRLSASVERLRKKGHNIVSESIAYEDPISGGDVKVAEYRLA